MFLQAFSDTAKSQAAAKKLAKGECQQTRQTAGISLVKGSLLAEDGTVLLTSQAKRLEHLIYLRAVQRQTSAGAGHRTFFQM